MGGLGEGGSPLSRWRMKKPCRRRWQEQDAAAMWMTKAHTWGYIPGSFLQAVFIKKKSLVKIINTGVLYTDPPVEIVNPNNNNGAPV